MVCGRSQMSSSYLQQWVLSELSVHCAAVERLSATAALLGVVDPNSAMLRCVTLFC